MTTPTHPALAVFTSQKTVLLTTYKRDGTPVGTPVNIAVDGDHAHIRTHGLFVPLAHRLKRDRTLHYEVRPLEDEPPKAP